MKNLDVFSLKPFFFIMTPLKEARESFCGFIGFVLTIIIPKIISRKLLDPTDLTKAQTFHIHKLLKVVLIG